MPRVARVCQRQLSYLLTNSLHKPISVNCNFVKNLSILLYKASENEQLKNKMHSLATSYDLVKNIFLKALWFCGLALHSAIDLEVDRVDQPSIDRANVKSSQSIISNRSRFFGIFKVFLTNIPQKYSIY